MVTRRILPVTQTVIAPAATALGFTSYAPQQATVASAGVGSVALSGQAPTQGIQIVVGAGGLGLTGGIPQLQGRYTLAPPNGVVALGGQAPALLANTLIVPNVGASLAVTGYAPTLVIAIETIILPPAALLAVTGVVPSIGTGTQIPGTSIVLTSYAPAARVTSTLYPNTAVALALTGNVPVQGIEIIPGAGSVGLSGGVPQLQGQYAVQGVTGAVAYTAQAPVTVLNSFITPAAGGMVTAGQPVVAYGVLIANAGALALTGFAPTITESMSPAAVQIALVGNYPVIYFSSPGLAAQTGGVGLIR